MSASVMYPNRGFGKYIRPYPGEVYLDGDYTASKLDNMIALIGVFAGLVKM